MSLPGFDSFGPSWVLEEEDESCNDGGLASVQHLSSPINVQSKETRHSDTLFRKPLELYYVECRDTVLENTGSIVRILLSTSCELAGGPLPDGSIFRLREVVFHWGRDNFKGSEHTVNGQAFPMEVQFVHWNTSLYKSYEDAVGKQDGVCIIALFGQVGRQNNGLQIIAQNLWSVRFKDESKVITALFSPESLLPHPSLRDFWTYRGSLTCSPFAEDVTWILMRYPMTVSLLQLEEFRLLLTYKKGEMTPIGKDGIMVDNFRTVQALQGRVILSSFE